MNNYICDFCGLSAKPGYEMAWTESIMKSSFETKTWKQEIAKQVVCEKCSKNGKGIPLEQVRSRNIAIKKL